jgi:hypothetical protein
VLPNEEHWTVQFEIFAILCRNPLRAPGGIQYSSGFFSSVKRCKDSARSFFTSQHNSAQAQELWLKGALRSPIRPIVSVSVTLTTPIGSNSASLADPVSTSLHYRQRALQCGARCNNALIKNYEESLASPSRAVAHFTLCTRLVLPTTRPEFLSIRCMRLLYYVRELHRIQTKRFMNSRSIVYIFSL